MEKTLEQYLTTGVLNLVRGISRAVLKNPKAAAFMAEYAISNRSANQKRKDFENRGEHIPPFLIASITTKCNLHCKGCYARANHGCVDSEEAARKLLSTKDWERIFAEAEDLGISFILLAGGEPLLRQDVLSAAGLHRKILFPVFTNGTMLQNSGLRLLSDNPNLLPVLSIEGSEKETDGRRGIGTYTKLLETMALLKRKSMIFGISVTVQKNNLQNVMSGVFVKQMQDNGCKAIIYVEYVPVDSSTVEIAPGPKERKSMTDRLADLRDNFPEMIFLSFPGDEQAMGGCLAAGRGFFHINAYGSAEPCPFSAYSDLSLKNHSLEEALHSPLFQKLQNCGMLEESHVGGCTLFAREAEVRELIGETS